MRKGDYMNRFNRSMEIPKVTVANLYTGQMEYNLENIINNSDCKILLDQRKYMNKFDAIQSLLGLTEKEKSQILSINMANNPSRLYKEVWIGLGGTQSAVYATEVSAEEYLAYTTEETEKVEVYRLAEQLGGDIEAVIRQLAERRRKKE